MLHGATRVSITGTSVLPTFGREEGLKIFTKFAILMVVLWVFKVFDVKCFYGDGYDSLANKCGYNKC